MTGQWSRPDRTIVHALRAVADRRSEQTFCTFISEDRAHDITYRELLSRAQAYTNYFGVSGLRRGDIVFIILRHHQDLLFAFVGALLGGFIPSFLAPVSEKQEPETYWATLRHLFDSVGAAAALIEPDDLDAVTAAIDASRTKILRPPFTDGATADVEWPDLAPDDIAFLQFSSGTTGLRKGVMLTHRIVLQQIGLYHDALNLAPSDRIASWLPLYHDMGLIACFILPLVVGIPVVMLDAFEWVYEPAILFAAIDRYRATLAWLPNFAFNHLRATVGATAGYNLRTMRAYINCSEPCKIDSMRRFAEHFAPMGVRVEQMQTCYAMAEAVFAVTQSALGMLPVTLLVDRDILAGEGRAEAVAPGGTAVELVSVGRLLSGFELRIIGPDRHEVAEGQIGEIIIRGPSVFGGYYRASRPSDEAFADGWYLTGDLGFVSDHELYVTGRSKDIIIAYGKNYYSHDIEALANGVSGIKPGRVVAFGVYNGVSGSEDVVVVAETEQAAGHGDIVDAVRSTVGAGLGLAVSSVILVPPKWLIKTTSGKIGRAQNREKYLRMISDGITSPIQESAVS